MGDPIPSHRLWQGAYIDDGGFVYRGPMGELRPGEGPDRDLALRALDACKKEHFAVAEHRGFGFGSKDSLGREASALFTFVLWGTEVRSDPGVAGVERSKRFAIAEVALQTLALPRIERSISGDFNRFLFTRLCTDVWL